VSGAALVTGGSGGIGSAIVGDTVTSRVLGDFQVNAELRSEFLQLTHRS
jgi:NAD(P)-dependent dehydrogenase (short-subunit alcohol dehydrogenase family)